MGKNILNGENLKKYRRGLRMMVCTNSVAVLSVIDHFRLPFFKRNMRASG